MSYPFNLCVKFPISHYFSFLLHLSLLFSSPRPAPGLVQALERQKEYSDLTRDERDALRDEVFRLRDALKVERLGTWT